MQPLDSHDSPSIFFIGNITNAASKKTAKGASLTLAIVSTERTSYNIYFLIMSSALYCISSFLACINL
ncbi:hypothetical protein MtrunA17_Chr3g0111141 [Medicago truncatula]|uniref:Transmembrane protein n=1 Tax=Medicago truncatula TaxID=3880 RepID=A0A396IU77_MEDTR|nr:hypothetical protein MtrunA17_Chr3g0111141 [Medicago truncatula]